MNLKTFRAKSMAQALAEVKKQLGKEQLIAHVLILPTDAHGGNFLVSRETPRKLISLDMEASFVPLRSNETTEIQFVSELFCHSFIQPSPGSGAPSLT